MDGSRYIPIAGAPDDFKQTRPLDSLAAPSGWSTPPVPLLGGGFAIGSRNGRVFIFNDRDSLDRTIAMEANIPVDQLLTDSNAMYAIAMNGDIFAYTRDGRLLWKTSTNKMLTGNAIMAGNTLIVPSDSEIVAFDKKSGAIRWKHLGTLECSTLAANDLSENIFAGLTHNESDATDSILVLNANGDVESRMGLPGFRITSNIALCGKEKNIIAVGMLGASVGQRSQAAVVATEIEKDYSYKQLWRHALPYLVLNIAANSDEIVASGFRTLESEMVSGIDAFAIADTSVRWSRRFTEPVATPLAIGNSDIYFTMTFETQAIVASKGLFYTLRAATGKTISERPIAGAQDGFIPAMPMPDERGRLLVADGRRPVVYLLDRSAFQRVF
jgi:outer membrane protein assembly factor BamB